MTGIRHIRVSERERERKFNERGSERQQRETMAWVDLTVGLNQHLEFV